MARTLDTFKIFAFSAEIGNPFPILAVPAITIILLFPLHLVPFKIIWKFSFDPKQCHLAALGQFPSIVTNVFGDFLQDV